MSKRLCYYDHPILRKKADPVVNFDVSLLELVCDLKETVIESRGIGLAAPQIGVSLRVFISCVKGEDEDGRLILWDEPFVYVNPVLTNPSDRFLFASEGCLSIPKLKAPVARPDSITVSFYDVTGNAYEECYTGFCARVIMHENDHLNGVLFIDRLDKKEKKKIEKELTLIKKKYAGFR